MDVSFEERLQRAVAKVAEKHKKLHSARDLGIDCEYAVPEGRPTSCCGQSFRCSNHNSPNFRRLGTSKRCLNCLNEKHKAKGLLSIIIPVIDENPKDLQTTLETIKTSCDRNDYELIIIDDCSRQPVKGATLRNNKRLGATKSRKLGFEMAKGEFACFPDSHMKLGDGNLSRLVALADRIKGIAYCGCNKHPMCRIKNVDGLPVAKWAHPSIIDKKRKAQIQTTAMMGACYVVPSDVLRNCGGWVGLDGFLGSQEIAQSINMWKHGVPIFNDLAIENWHKFRTQPSAPVPAPGWHLNRLLTLRLLFEDGGWERWKKRILVKKKTRHIGVQFKDIIAQCEEPQYEAYGKLLRRNHVKTDDEFFQFLDGSECK